MVQHLKESRRHDIFIGGPTLAAYAFRAGLIDECHLFVAPFIIGSGKRGLPSDVFLTLELFGERRIGNVVCLVYSTTRNKVKNKVWE